MINNTFNNTFNLNLFGSVNQENISNSNPPVSLSSMHETYRIASEQINNNLAATNSNASTAALSRITIVPFSNLASSFDAYDAKRSLEIGLDQIVLDSSNTPSIAHSFSPDLQRSSVTRFSNFSSLNQSSSSFLDISSQSDSTSNRFEWRIPIETSNAYTPNKPEDFISVSLYERKVRSATPVDFPEIPIYMRLRNGCKLAPSERVKLSIVSNFKDQAVTYITKRRKEFIKIKTFLKSIQNSKNQNCLSNPQIWKKAGFLFFSFGSVAIGLGMANNHEWFIGAIPVIIGVLMLLKASIMNKPAICSPARIIEFSRLSRYICTHYKAPVDFQSHLIEWSHFQRSSTSKSLSASEIDQLLASVDIFISKIDAIEILDEFVRNLSLDFLNSFNFAAYRWELEYFSETMLKLYREIEVLENFLFNLDSDQEIIREDFREFYHQIRLTVDERKKHYRAEIVNFIKYILEDGGKYLLLKKYLEDHFSFEKTVKSCLSDIFPHISFNHHPIYRLVMGYSNELPVAKIEEIDNICHIVTEYLYTPEKFELRSMKHTWFNKAIQFTFEEQETGLEERGVRNTGPEMVALSLTSKISKDVFLDK